MTVARGGRGTTAAGPELVGRDDELTALSTAWAEAASGQGRLVIVAGSAGMGKTALARHLADAAARDEALVAWGRCWDPSATPPYWPWIQVVRSLLDSVDSGVFAAAVGDSAVDLARLVPEVARVFDLPPPTARGDSDRFPMFDAVARLLHKLSRRRPLLVVLEDLDQGDEASAELSAFVARQLVASHILLLVTVYDDRAGVTRGGSPLEELRPHARVIDLRPLDRAAVDELCAREAGPALPEPVSAAIYSATEGNPFFVIEAAKLASSEGGIHRPDHSLGFRVPRGARDLIRVRLRPLSDETLRTLSVAAVLGVEFDRGLLQEVAGLAESSVLAVLDEALDAGVLREVSILGRYRFSHTLVRETLYEELTPAERMHVHRAAAETLEHRYTPDSEIPLEKLAHHYFKAAQAGDADKTLDYAVRAAERAVAAMAFEEAARLYRRALSVADVATKGRSRRAQIQRALDRLQQQMREGTVDPHAEAPLQTNVFRRMGDFWSVEFAGKALQLRDTMGARYLAHLLAAPGRELAALELVAAVHGHGHAGGAAASEAGLTATSAGVGPILDDKARAGYKRRLQELQEDIEEAEQDNDAERAARATVEMDALLHELGTSMGLGGRPREAGSDAERARLSVTKAIWRTIRKIEQEHSDLGRHLRATVRTGLFCAYVPDPRTPITWQM